jgi:hypothetical protein
MTTRGVDVNVSEHEARVFEDVFKPALVAMLANSQLLISTKTTKKDDGVIYSITISVPSAD